MSPDREVTDGVLELLGRYPQAVDRRDFSAWADLFEKDGLFTVDDKSIRGRDSLRDYVSRSPRGVHLSSLPYITLEAGEANSVSSFLFHNAETGAMLTGYYYDRIEITSKPYLFIVRKVDIVGRS